MQSSKSSPRFNWPSLNFKLNLWSLPSSKIKSTNTFYLPNQSFPPLCYKIANFESNLRGCLKFLPFSWGLLSFISFSWRFLHVTWSSLLPRWGIGIGIKCFRTFWSIWQEDFHVIRWSSRNPTLNQSDIKFFRVRFICFTGELSGAIAVSLLCNCCK